MPNAERSVATVFVTDGFAATLADTLADQCDKLIDHYTAMIDARHHTDSEQKPKRIKVTVTLEDA